MATNNDDLLELELKVSSDDESFKEATGLLEDLRYRMEDTTVTLGIDKAVDALKIAVDLWNKLENKAITASVDVGTYLPYNITPGQRRAISRIDEQPLPAELGLTSQSVLDAFTAIITKQNEALAHGQVTEKDWESVVQLAQYADKLGLKEAQPFLGENLSQTLMYSDTMSVYTALTDLIASVQRKAYGMDKAGREEAEQYAQAVVKSDYIDPGAFNYITLRVKPTDPSYGKMGNPMVALMSGLAGEAGAAGAILDDVSSLAADASQNLYYYKGKIKHATDALSMYSYTAISNQLFTPVLGGVAKQADLLTGEALWNGKLRPGAEFLNYSSRIPEDTRARFLAPVFGYTRDFVQPTIDMDTQVSKFKQQYAEAQASGDVLGQELALYELGALGNASRDKVTEAIASYALYSLTNMLYKEELESTPLIKRGKVRKSHYQDVIAQMSDPESPYYIDPTAGESAVYSMLYDVGAISQDEYMSAIRDMINASNARILNFYGMEKGTQNVEANNMLKDNMGTLEIIVTNSETKQQQRFEWRPGMQITVNEMDGINSD